MVPYDWIHTHTAIFLLRDARIFSIDILNYIYLLSRNKSILESETAQRTLSHEFKMNLKVKVKALKPKKTLWVTVTVK